jgi:HAD superfamily hydrolase (TIGR01509 family)
MIKAIVFDLGKVLVDFDYAIASRKLAARCTITENELGLFTSESSLLSQYETGLLSTDQFFSHVCSLTGFAGDLNEFGSYFADIFVPIDPMVRLHAEVRTQGLPTYIFSNTNELAVRHIRRSFPFFGGFDGYVFSYEHGAMKPDPALYAVLERQARCCGGQILYLDDRPENVQAGAVRGWQVILHETPEKSRAMLKRLGLLNHR